MNNDMFIIDYDPFAMDSRITVRQNNNRTMLNVSSDLPELINQLINYTKEYNIYQVRIHAPMNVFYEAKRQLEEAEKNLYNETKIEMEIC